MKRILVPLVLSAVSCGNQLQATGNWNRPFLLSVCKNEDPVPNAVDDERSLCAFVELGTVGPGSFAIDATTSFASEADGGTRFDAPGPTQASAINGVWGRGACFAPLNPNAVTQTLTGRLDLGSVSDSQITGSIHVKISGALAGSACGWSMPAELSGSFQVTR